LALIRFFFVQLVLLPGQPEAVRTWPTGFVIAVSYPEHWIERMSFMGALDHHPFSAKALMASSMEI
jgi:hypothetical protein